MKLYVHSASSSISFAVARSMKTHYLKMYNKSFCAPWSSKKSGDSSDGGRRAVLKGRRYKVKHDENMETLEMRKRITEITGEKSWTHRKIENGRQKKLRIFSFWRWWNLLFFPSTREFIEFSCFVLTFSKAFIHLTCSFRDVEQLSIMFCICMCFKLTL